MLPLEGTKIIDLTHALAGPMCTYHLALLGAEVIKIENPRGGDDFRHFAKTAFDAVNGGKKSVILDLKKPEAIEVLRRLAEDADVVVDNFKPGTAERYGLTWETVQSWSERLIWSSISGYGLTGPWRDNPAVEWSAQAASGLSDSYLGADQDPHDLGLGVLDIATGASAASSIMAALLLRAKTGKGSRIDVAMIDVALTFLAPRISVDGPTAMRRRAGVGRFATKDDPIFLMGAHQRWFEAIASVLGEPNLLEDPRFATLEARAKNRTALREALEERLATRSADEWEEEMTGVGVPAARIRRLPDVVASEHMQQRGSLLEASVDDKAMPVIGLPYLFVDQLPLKNLAVPALGQQTDSVLAAAGFDAGEIASLHETGVI